MLAHKEPTRWSRSLCLQGPRSSAHLSSARVRVTPQPPSEPLEFSDGSSIGAQSRANREPGGTLPAPQLFS